MAIINKFNNIAGAFITILSSILGIYWYLFAGYLLLNIIDWITGWYKARKLKQESSIIGLKGIIKKLGYWGIILVAFLMPTLFIRLGNDLLKINLEFLYLFGWFTLASLLVNEIRSILENFVECGYRVPAFLIKGLSVIDELVNTETENIHNKN